MNSAEKYNFELAHSSCMLSEILVPQDKIRLPRCCTRWPSILDTWIYSNLEVYSAYWESGT